MRKLLTLDPGGEPAMSESLVEWASGDHDDAFREASLDDLDAHMAEPPHPINWNLLSADDTEAEWIELNRWVNWLRRTYGLPASVVPPFWHRHPEFVWKLSALHCTCTGSAPTTPTSTAPPRAAGTATSRMPASGFTMGRQRRGRGWSATVRLSRLLGRGNYRPTQSKTWSLAIVIRTSCSSSSTMSNVAAVPRHRFTLTLNLVDIARPWLLRRAQKGFLRCRS